MNVFIIGRLFLHLLLIHAPLNYLEQVKKEDRKVEGFSSLQVSSGIAVHISQLSKQSVRVEADEETSRDVVTEVTNGVLSIHYKSSNKFKLTNRECKVYVSAPVLHGVEMSSGSSLKGDFWKTDEKFTISARSGSSVSLNLQAISVRCECRGGSSVSLDLTARQFNCSTNAGSSVKAKGTTSAAVLEALSGSTIIASELKSDTVNVTAFSASSVQINVSKSLTAKSSSASKISYSGNPPVVKLSENSLGKIKRL